MEKDHTRIRVAILLVSLALFALLLMRSRGSAPLASRETYSPVVIEVKGDVPNPGIHVLDMEKATAGFAAFAAGRREIPAETASQRLESGQSLEILGHGAGTAVRFGRMPAPVLLACGLKLDLNSATLEELLLIPHMRSSIANAIVERRREQEWQQVDDLTELRGVGPKTLRKLQDYLEVLPRQK